LQAAWSSHPVRANVGTATLYTPWRPVPPAVATAQATVPQAKDRAPRPLLAGNGYIDSSYFIRSLSGQGGYFVVSGWYSLIGDTSHRPTKARVRIGDEQWTIPWGLHRPDVAAANKRHSAYSGFSATLPLTHTPHPGSEYSIDFLPEHIVGNMTRLVEFPDLEVEVEAATLTPLRLKKLRNLILNEQERLSHAERVHSMPVTGQIDPAFACNLECPHCNSQMLREDRFVRPNMRLNHLDAILAKYGDHLVRIWLSLWGEPLLNKQLPKMIAKCKAHDIWVLISSNMSVPLKDEMIDALVESGLDSINLSIDGATQATYEKYRKGGNLALVLENARRFVAAKRRLNSATPHLLWRYLEFPWTRDEIEAARQLATAIGVDEFEVSPGVLTPQTKHSQSERPVDDLPRPPPPELLAERSQQAHQRGAQYEYFGCDYLYQSISINSDGVVHPCCYVVSPAHAIGSSQDSIEAARNGNVLRSGRQFYRQLAAGSQTVVSHEPCLSCDVMTSTGGHVTTQTNFRQLYEYLLRGVPMRW
jgi:MoaA/NifB/PqqE/SkfB family radical SAM enzyme